MNRRAVFFDRDGTIMEDSNYVGDVERVVLIPGSVEALRQLQDAGYKLFVITNQSGVGRGYFTRDAVDEIHRHLDGIFSQAGVRFDRYYICPHHPEDNCACRKPNAKFLTDAANEYGIDLGRSFMVGDRASDIQAGINAGTKTILVLTGAGETTRATLPAAADFTARDIRAATEWILNQN